MTNNRNFSCPNCKRETRSEELCYACRNKNLRVEYESMTNEQIDVMIINIIENVDKMLKDDNIYKDFNGLLAYQNINTKQIAQAAFEKSIFFPPTLYKDASEDIQSKLITLISNPDCKNANELLICLAIIGTEKVRASFFELEQNPLPWRKKLYADPSIYAESGGWTFDTNGIQKELLFESCYALTEQKHDDSEILVAKPRPENCSVCGCQTINILSLDTNDKRLSFLGLKGTLNIPICPNCSSMCEKTVIHYQLNGESTFEIIDPYEEGNFISKEDFEKITSNNLTLSQSTKPKYYAWGNDSISIIGGSPDWIQDSQYENCPNCQQKMKLLSVISWDQLLPWNEGNLYIEICIDCSIVTTFHQQS